MDGKPIICSLCDRDFGNPGAFALHKKIHTPQDVCKNCLFRIDPQVPHRCDIPQTYVTCEFCSLRVHTEQDLQDHVVNDHTLIVNSKRQNLFYNCGMCQRSFTDKFKLAKHANRCSKYPCGDCGIGFAKRADLQRHAMIHTGEKPFQCPICNKRFRQRSHMRLHHQQTHGLIPKLKCKYCSASYKTHLALSKHIKRCHPDYQKDCKTCFNCKIVFPDDESFQNHLPTESRNSFNCDQCCRKMSTESGLAQHKRTHTYKQISCPICEVQYTYQGSLYKHLASTHYKVHPMMLELQDNFTDYLRDCMMYNGFQLNSTALHDWQFQASKDAILVCVPSAIITIVISENQTKSDFTEIKRLSDFDRFVYRRDRAVWIFVNTGSYWSDGLLCNADYKKTAHWVISSLLFRNYLDIPNPIELMYRNWDLNEGLSDLFDIECGVEEIVSSSFTSDYSP